MKLDVEFPELAALVVRLGAPPSVWTLDEGALPPPKTISRIEVDVKLDDVEFTAEGLATIQGQHVLLYIKEGRKTKDVLINNPSGANRFHVADCDTLATKKRAGTFEQRYVATNDTSGTFRCVAFDPVTRKSEEDEVLAELKVCMNCLVRLNYKGYSDSKDRQIWLNFSLRDFFDHYSARFSEHPKRKDTDTSRNEYTKDWPDISRGFRQSKNWKCEGCGVDLSKKRNLLETHHIDRDKRNNSLSNLQALCVLCHQKHHPDMHVHFADRQEIMRRRADRSV